MIIQIKRTVWETIGAKKLVPFGLKEDRLSWSGTDFSPINLANLKLKELTDLADLLGKQTGKDYQLLVKDIERWKAALTDAPNAKARTVEGFEGLLKNYLVRIPNQWLFSKQRDDGPDAPWLGFYVSFVKYHPPEKRRDDYHPAYVSMNLMADQFGGTQVSYVNFYDEDIKGKTVQQALAEKGYYPNDPTHGLRYLDEMARFTAAVKQVGTQFLASGSASEGPDGNPERKRDTWYSRRAYTFPMVRDGQKAKVVMDVFFEEREAKDTDPKYDRTYWATIKAGKAKADDEDDDDSEPTDLDKADLPTIPVHPWCVVFDLGKHLRLQLHINQLEPYDYDKQIADKLVLSADRKALVKLLIESKQLGFHDIVQGKGGGAVVLLAGPPGTGKTLTAEVYAESEGRALYSVQCSQLGTDPDTLEQELLRVFARARRWNAVMLLDEADVYVHERGNDLNQNAIVGVFLRVLEYQASILFLTTNRPDDVDDAIASRCIAKLTYELPTLDEQKAIWQVLAQVTGATVTDDSLDAIIKKNPQLSGRDVKNLLKLARVLGDGDIQPEAVEFVKQFKPTRGQDAVVPAGVGRCPDCGQIRSKNHKCPKQAGNRA